MADYSSKFNTLLNANQEALFNSWLSKQSTATGRDVAKDLYDYDLKGWWKNNQGIDLNDGHLTDTYKKPNHPTFSDQSQFHGVDGNQGGSWTPQIVPDGVGGWSFTPGATNLQMYQSNELQQYFKQVEPRNKLVLPNG